MQLSEIQPGVIVFGKLMGFPWWPAVVSTSQTNGNWTNKGKYWVLFFNETNGAWLKQSDLRSFDSYNKDLCIEQNGTTLKYRRYKERVEKAITLAEKYQAMPKEKRGNKGLPPLPSDLEEVVSISDDGESERPSDEKEPETGKKRRRGRPPLKKPRSKPSTSKKLNALDNGAADAEYTPVRRVNSEGGRPRRKRIKSSRYDDFLPQGVDRNLSKRKIGRSSSAEELSGRDHDQNVVQTLGEVAQKRVPSHAQNGTSGRRSKGKRLKGSQVTATDPLLSVPKRLTRMRDEKRDVESLDDTISDDRAAVLAQPVTSRRLANDPIHRPRFVMKKRSSAAVTREMYISELTSLGNPKHEKKGKYERGKVLSVRKSVRSRAGGSSGYDDSSRSGQGTDSEEWPERERRVRSGSLEAAAEDLVDYAVRGGHDGGSNSSAGCKNIMDMNAVALGGNGLVASILNRISDIERDVSLLKKKSINEEVATLGEDAAAAGVKAAVEALASATAAFAKARDFDPGAINRSLDLLWPDNHFPLSGHDGDLLHMLTRSLVLASCKRRREHEFNERNKITQRKQPEKERINLTPIMQKADIRQRIRKSIEDVDGDIEKPLVRSSSQHNGVKDVKRLGALLPSKAEEEVPLSRENPHNGDEGHSRREKLDGNDDVVTTQHRTQRLDRRGREDIGGNQCLANGNKKPNQRIRYTPEKKPGGGEFVEEEILGDGNIGV